MKTTVYTRRGFTLLELLLVMAIIVLMVTAIAPATSSIVKGSAMSQAIQSVSAQFSFAQQTAVAKNCNVEMRFYQTPDPVATTVNATKSSWRIHAVQSFIAQNYSDKGVTKVKWTALNKIDWLPNAIILSADKKYSSLIDPMVMPPIDQTSSQAMVPPKEFPKIPGIVQTNYQYYSVVFRPDGGTNLGASSKWYVTMYNANYGDTITAPPPDFATLALDPVQGSVQLYRPM